MRSNWWINNQLKELGDLRLRSAQPRDDHFLLQLFRSSRPHLSQIPMPMEFIAALVQQQYDLQRNSYSNQFPGYLDLLVIRNQEFIGAFKLYKNDEYGWLHLLDIAILPAHQGRGYGHILLRSLQNLAAHNDWVLRLSVDRQNWRAKQLYVALDFRLENSSATHEEMVWTSTVYAG